MCKSSKRPELLFRCFLPRTTPGTFAKLPAQRSCSIFFLLTGCLEVPRAQHCSSWCRVPAECYHPPRDGENLAFYQFAFVEPIEIDRVYFGRYERARYNRVRLHSTLILNVGPWYKGVNGCGGVYRAGEGARGKIGKSSDFVHVGQRTRLT